MKIFKTFLLVTTISLMSFAGLTYAQAGACSGHDGVNCQIGADTDGSAICNDGWKGSSVQYSSLKTVCGADYVEPEVFSDLAKTHKNRDAILYLKERNIISGYDNGTFKPENTVNRAELLTILLRSKNLSLDSAKYQGCFNDVQTQWFAVPICYAKEQGWVNGYDDGTFKPDQTVNKAEAIKMILNSQNIPISNTVSANPFSDVDKTIWFAPFIKVAKDLGILEETGSMLTPDEKMKRASVSENIFRLLKYLESNPQPTPEETSYEYDITRISISSSITNWDNDAEDDGLEISPYFYFLSKANPTEGEQMSAPSNRDWSANISIYDEIDNKKGDLLYEGYFNSDQVMYDTLGYPFVRVPTEKIKDAGHTKGIIVGTFSSSRGSFSAENNYATIRNETDESLASENQIKQLDIRLISGWAFWTNWDSDAEDDGFELNPHFKDHNDESVYPNSKDWTVTVEIYNAERDYTKYDDFNTHKTDLVNTLNFSVEEVQYDSLKTPFVRVTDEDLYGLKVGDGQFIVEATFSSPTYGKFALEDDPFDKRKD